MTTASIRVDGPDRIGQARRSAAALASEVGFDEEESARVALVATECATNLWKHAQGGEILLTARNAGFGRPESGIEILALDNGPGIPDAAQCFEDGYSTAGGAGTGLGAIRRLSYECDVYSVGGKGTALLTRCWKPDAGRPGRPATLSTGALSVPAPGEDVCGDGCAVMEAADFATVMVADGLGHGQFAHQAASAAGEVFEENAHREPDELLSRLHDALNGTRGAAISVARLDFTRREVRFCGIGNVTGLIHDGVHAYHMVSQPGIVGSDSRRIRVFTYSWPMDSTVLLYSDGIATHWSLDRYEGLMFRDPSLIAGVLYRDWNRGRDDATILAIRDRHECRVQSIRS